MKFNKLILSVSFYLILSTGFILCSNLANASDKVDEFILSEMQKKNIPRMSIAIVKDGKIVKMQGYGLASIELNVPVTPETVFQSGSIGKQFTATLIMILVEQGKLKLTDKINQFIKEAPKKWESITIYHLLTHTSGLKNYNYKNNSMGFNFCNDYTDDELIKMAASLPLEFKAGEKWEYSNTGYVMLGMIIKKVTGKHWGDVAEQHIFKPLDMKTARIISEEDIILNRAAGYRLVNGEIKNQQYVSPSLNRTADGSLYLTVLDLAKWDKALYGEKILKKESLRQMWTPAKLNNGKAVNYGFGWEFEELNKHPVIFHGGSWQGFSGEIDRFVNDNLTIIYLTNREAGLGNIGYGIAGQFDPAFIPADPQKLK
jgi:CubicO group peptidase (beta-lactamase class C family)